MLLRSRRNDSKPAAGPSADPVAARALNHGRIDLVFGAVAINRGTRSPRDHRPAAALERAPYEPVDERILEHGQRRLASRGETDQPVGIVAAGMRHGKQDRKIPARLVDDGGGELRHDLRVKFRARLGLAMGACNA